MHLNASRHLILKCWRSWGRVASNRRRQIEKIAAGSFLANQNPSGIQALMDMINRRLGQMERAPRALVKANSPFRLTEFGSVARKTGLGLTATNLIVKEMEEALEIDPDAFATMRDGIEVDRNKLKMLLSIMLSDPENFLDSFAIRTKSKDLFGVPISTLQRDIGKFSFGRLQR